MINPRKAVVSILACFQYVGAAKAPDRLIRCGIVCWLGVPEHFDDATAIAAQVRRSGDGDIHDSPKTSF